MYIRRKVFSTFIDTETGEERLFSTTEIDGTEVKEFSSKAQKARRAKFDIAVAKEMYGGTEGSTNDINKLKRAGRIKAKEGTIRRVGGAAGRLSYDHYGTRDLSKNTKNVFVDASKGKKRAIHEAEIRALLQRVKEPTDSKRYKSMGRLFDKLDAIENKAARTAKLKTAGKVGLGVAGAAGIGYGIKKAIDKNKKNKEDK